MTPHDQCQRRCHVDLLLPREVAKEIRVVILDMDTARGETLNLPPTKKSPKKKTGRKETPKLLKLSKEGCAGSVLSRQKAEPKGCKSVCGDGSRQSHWVTSRSGSMVPCDRGNKSCTVGADSALGRMWFAMLHGRDRLRARWRFSRTNFSQVCISKRMGEQLDEERCRDERVREGDR